MLHDPAPVNSQCPQQCELRAAQDAAALLQRLQATQRPKSVPDWIWDGLSPAGKTKLMVMFRQRE